ncbi:MAG: hypothetical protein ISS56_12980 [Anaerolineae bacterium]|nr:hypothetical protein [Anaerolineae bacterium]
MAELLRLVAWTPSDTLIDAQQVEWVHVTLAGGKGLTIWPGHAPLLAETVAETVRYIDRGGEHTTDLPSGILQIQDGTVTIFLSQAGSQAEAEGRYDRLAEMPRSPLPS